MPGIIEQALVILLRPTITESAQTSATPNNIQNSSIISALYQQLSGKNLGVLTDATFPKLRHKISSLTTFLNNRKKSTNQTPVEPAEQTETLRQFYLETLFTLIIHFKLASEFALRHSSSPLSKKFLLRKRKLWEILKNHFQSLGLTLTHEKQLAEIFKPNLYGTRQRELHLYYSCLLEQMIAYLDYSKIFILSIYHSSVDSLMQQLSDLIPSIKNPLQSRNNGTSNKIQEAFADLFKIISTKMQQLTQRPPNAHTFKEWQREFHHLRKFYNLLNYLSFQFKPLLPQFPEDSIKQAFNTAHENYDRAVFAFYKKFILTQLPTREGFFANWTVENRWVFQKILSARSGLRDKLEETSSNPIQYPNWDQMIKGLLEVRDTTHFHSSIWWACQNSVLLIINNQIDHQSPIHGYTQVIKVLAAIIHYDDLSETTTKIIKKLTSAFKYLNPLEKIQVIDLIQQHQTKHEIFHPIIYNLFLDCLNLQKDPNTKDLIPKINPTHDGIEPSLGFEVSENPRRVITLNDLLVRHNRYINSRRSILTPNQNAREAIFLLPEIPIEKNQTELVLWRRDVPVARSAPADSVGKLATDQLENFQEHIGTEIEIYRKTHLPNIDDSLPLTEKVSAFESQLGTLQASNQMGLTEFSALQSWIGKFHYSETIRLKHLAIRQNHVAKKAFALLASKLDQYLQAARMMQTGAFQVRGPVSLELARGAIQVGASFIPLSIAAQAVNLVGHAARMLGEYHTEYTLTELSNFTLTGTESSLFAQNLSLEIIYSALCEKTSAALKIESWEKLANAVFIRLLHVIRLHISDDDPLKTLDQLIQKYFKALSESTHGNTTFELADINALPNKIDLNSLLRKAHSAYKSKNTTNELAINYTQDRFTHQTDFIALIRRMHGRIEALQQDIEGLQQTRAVPALPAPPERLLIEDGSNQVSAMDLYKQIQAMRQEIALLKTSQPSSSNSTALSAGNINGAFIPLATNSSATLETPRGSVIAKTPQHVLVLRELAGKEIVMARDINRLIAAIETITPEDLKKSQGNTENGAIKILNNFHTLCADDSINTLPEILKNLVKTFRNTVAIKVQDEKDSGVFTQTFTLTHLFCTEVVKAMVWTKIDGEVILKNPSDETESMLFAIREFCFNETVLMTRRHAVTLNAMQAYKDWNEANQKLFACLPKIEISDQITTDNFISYIQPLADAFTNEENLVKWIEAFIKIKQCYQIISPYVKESPKFCKALANPDTFVGLPVLKELFNLNNLLNELVKSTEFLDTTTKQNIATIQLVIKGLLDNHQDYAYLGDPNYMHLLRTNNERRHVALKFATNILFFKTEQPPLRRVSTSPTAASITDRRLQRMTSSFNGNKSHH